ARTASGAEIDQAVRSLRRAVGPPELIAVLRIVSRKVEHALVLDTLGRERLRAAIHTLPIEIGDEMRLGGEGQRPREGDQGHQRHRAPGFPDFHRSLRSPLGPQSTRFATGIAHSSRPCSPSSAPNRIWPLATLKGPGLLAAEPGAMSPQRSVPSAVPSLLHGSSPDVPSSAANTTRAPTAFRFCGSEPRGPVRRSVTSRVDAAVPRDTHSSVPVEGRNATKKRLPRATVSSRAWETPARSLTRTVPA